MEDYNKIEWYVCKDIYVHKSIDLDSLEDDTLFSEIWFEGYGLSLDNDVDLDCDLQSLESFKNITIQRAIEHIYDCVEGYLYEDEEEQVEIFIDKIIMK